MSTQPDSDERVFLTPEQAVSMLDDDPRIHTFRNPAAGMMLGCDWDRPDLLAEIERWRSTSDTQNELSRR